MPPPEILARGPLAIEAYNKALLEGRTRVKRVPVMVIGQARSGKTSIKKSLMGKPFDPKEGITDGIEVDPSYFKVSTEIWKTKQEDDGAHSNPAISYEHRAARLTCGSLKKKGTTLKDRSVSPLTVRMDDTVPLVQGQELDVGFSNESSIRENHSKATEAAKDLEGKEGNLDLPADNVPHPSSQGGSYQSAGSQEDNPPLIVPEEVPEDVATLITEFLKNDDGKEDEKEVYSVLWDFGGQSVYYATHPLFLTPQAIYLLIYDLSRNVHDAAIPVGKQRVHEKVLDVHCRKTNLDYLDVWMSSVASLASQDEANPERPKTEKLPERLPPVFLVCTHADKPYGDTDSMTKAHEILGSLDNKPYSNHLFDVFAVDNTKSGSGQNCQEVIRLREEVRAVATELLKMKKDIPLKWLKYEKALRDLSERGHKWIPLDEARQVTEVCKIVSDDEFSTLLNFLHDQRILMHFSDTAELNKMVILDLHWLIDVFKKVITVKRYDPKERLFKNLWKKLQKTGILEGELLEHVWGPLFDKKETVEGLIAIMEKFSLLCAWPFSNGNLQYLVPSMLMSQPPDEVLQLLASARVASLFVKFDSGQVPQGLFPRLVLQFFQRCKKNSSSQLKEPLLFHNFARFHTRSDDGRSVIFLCHSTSIEVVVHSGSTVRNYSDDKHHPLDVLTCRDVVKQLKSLLNCMREEFCWLKHVKYELFVCCTVCCHSGSVKFCCAHQKQGCKQEECLHFFPESDLHKCQQFIICACPNSAVAVDNKVQVQQFAPWFPFLDEKKEAGDGSGGKHATAAGSQEITSFKSDPLSEKVLSRLAQDVCSSWKALGRQLCLTEAKLQQIEADNQELYDRCYSVLKTWTHAQASQATYANLARALRSKLVDRRDLVVKYCLVNEAQESKEVSSPIMDSSFTIKDGEPTEDEISSIANDLLEMNWKELGRELEVTDSVLATVDKDGTQLYEKIHAMLMEWKQVKGDDATYRHLAEGLKNVRMNDLIETFCCELKIGKKREYLHDGLSCKDELPEKRPRNKTSYKY